MTKQVAIDLAVRDGVTPNAIYQRVTREHRRDVAERIAFLKAWPAIWRHIKAQHETLPSSCVWSAWLAWQKARQKKGTK